jgi:hypothetical protein
MDTYTCEACGGTFNTNPDRGPVARAEAIELWGQDPEAGGMARVCEPCMREILAWVRNQWTRVCQN